MQYLYGTCKLTLTIEPSDHPNWWVDQLLVENGKP